MPDDLSNGEIARRMDRLELRYDVRFDRIDHKLDSLQFVHRDTYNAHLTALTDRIESLEENSAWLKKAIIGQILFPVIVALILAFALTR